MATVAENNSRTMDYISLFIFLALHSPCNQYFPQLSPPKNKYNITVNTEQFTDSTLDSTFILPIAFFKNKLNLVANISKYKETYKRILPRFKFLVCNNAIRFALLLNMFFFPLENNLSSTSFFQI